MSAGGPVPARGKLIALVLALPIALSLISSNALASVSLADSPAERAEAVSGSTPVLTQVSDMTLGVGETKDQALHATDGDGDPLTFTKATGPGYMTVTTTDPGTGAATGNVHLAPDSADAGAVTATVTVSDGSLSASKSFRINVQGTPAAPVLTALGDMTIDAGDSQSQFLYASDANGDPLGFYLASGPSYVAVSTLNPGGASSTATGELTVSPGPSVSGTASATVGVSDGNLSDEKSLTITVNRVNVGPVLAQPAAMIARINETKDQDITASDDNGDPVTFSKVSGPAYMTVSTMDASARTGRVRLTPGSGDVGTSTGQIRASDGVLTDQKSFGITVRTNSPPSIYLPYSVYIRGNTVSDEYISAYDSDGDPLTFSKVAGPAYATVVTADPGHGNAYGYLHLAPTAQDVGTTSVTVRVSDGLASIDGFVYVTVQPPNRAPVLSQPADMTLSIGEIGEQTVTATDADGDYLTFSKSSGPAYVTVNGYGYGGSGSATITAKPGAGDAGTATVSVMVSDYYTMDTKSFMINVQAGSFPALCSAGAFSPSTMFVGSGLIEVQSADLNGDGALDLVAELADEQRVAVLLGTGDGSLFSPPSYLSAGQTPASGAIADFNGDEVPDLAVTNYGGNSVSIFIGDGAGGFGPKQDFPCGGSSRSVAAGDMNRDGKIDLVVARTSVSSVAVLRGNGNGTFAAPVGYTTGSDPWGISLPDLNRDGAPDVVVTDPGESEITVLLNNGSGGLGSRTDYPVGYGPLGVSTGDLNGDGKPDVAVACGDMDYISVFLGTGTGSLGPRRNFPTHDRPSLMAIADVNGDGYPDLATANYYSGDASILLGNGAGAFAPRTDVPSGSAAYGIAAGDFDDDLRTDLVVTSYYSGSLTFLVNGCAPLRDHPPVVHAPKLLTANEGFVVSFAITANDPDGPAISLLTASFAGLPLGHNATFGADPGNAGGSFAWTPGYMDARPTAYTVTFTAANVLSGSATTKILVKNTNRAPVANTGGPYSAFVNAAVTFNGSASADPDGDPISLSWVYGDGATGTGLNPVHTYVGVGVYALALTVTDGTLYNVATTTVNIVGMLQGRAFTANGNRNIKLNSGKPQWCMNVEPVGRSYANVAVDLTTLVLKSAGTGSVDQIRAIQDKVSISGDHDGNGVEEIEACFTKDDLRLLFSDLHGNTTVTVTVEGTLFAGGIFRAQMDLTIQAGGGQLAASVSPNPLNPDAVLTFSTGKAGWARVDLFDLRGRLVRRLLDEPSLSPGYHDVRVDGRDDHGERLASGVYFFRVHAGGDETTGQMTILK